ncbi:MAG: hypothetical protein EPN20_02690, partial [Magnetospirillum sp.]
MARSGRRDRVAAGTVLITEGRQIDCMYILLDGRMAVSLKIIGNVATLSSGEIDDPGTLPVLFETAIVCSPRARRVIGLTVPWHVPSPWPWPPTM